MTNHDERHELDGLRKLDSQVIGAVYDRYFPAVYRFVLYRLGNENIAEDIASDVFMRLLEAVKNGRAPQTNLKGWLIGTSSHVVMDHLRRKYRRPVEEISDSLADPESDPVSEADRRDRDQTVKQAYSQLTSEQQQVIAMRFGQGYSLEETASLMNKNVNAIKALQFRALASLQRDRKSVV